MHNTKIVTLDKIPTKVEASTADSYTDNIESHAAELRPLLNFAKSKLRSDDVVFDVGANVGLTTIGLARMVPNGRVIAFEPSPKNTERLRLNLEANGIHNVDVVQAAVSSRAGGIHFVEAPGSGSASHVQPSVAHRNVPTVSLDEYRDVSNGRGPALIKIDVEGHEPWVLDSASKILEEFQTDLWMEFNSWCLLAFARINPVEFAEQLISSFSMFTTADGVTLKPVEDYLSFAHDNIVLSGCVTDLVLRANGGVFSHASFAPNLMGGRQSVPSERVDLAIARRCALLEAEVHTLRSRKWRFPKLPHIFRR